MSRSRSSIAGLPFGSAFGAQRLGLDGLSDRSGPRDHRQSHRVGDEVTRFKAGDTVAVGCMVDSCQHCDQCRKGEEQLCREGNHPDLSARPQHAGSTYGGYSEHVVVRQEFVLRSAGWTRPRPGRPAPMRRHHHLFAAAHLECRSGSRVAVIGLGGLGHMALKLAKALGAHVTVFTRTTTRKTMPCARSRRCCLTDQAAMAKAAAELRPHHRHGPRRSRRQPVHAAA